MSNKKTIVLMGASEKSWEDALRSVVRNATNSVQAIDAIDVVHQSAAANKEGEIEEFRVTVHITFSI